MIKKCTWRDMAWLCLGLFAGFVLCYTIMQMWFHVQITGIVEHLPSGAIQIQFNETEMIEAGIRYMNETGMLTK